MNDLDNKLRGLKLKKALLLSDIESLSEVDETLFTQLGKAAAEISKVEKLLVRTVEDDFQI